MSEYEENDMLCEGSSSELPWVSEEMNSQLERPAEVQGLHVALQSMPRQKAPGINGLSVKFYKAF